MLAKLADGSYQVTETTGEVTKFRADGKLDYIEDVHGNRITAGYTANRLSSLTHSSGGSLSISYNAAGLIGSVSDSAGRVTTYAYDPTNTFLTSVTGPQGTTRYTYDTSANPTRAFALLTVQDPSGVVQHFDYDSHGRLSSTYLGNHLQQVDYTYDSAGTVTVTDATGVFNKLFYDYRGLLVRTEDSVGNFINYEYDANFHLAREVNSLGYSREYTWCDCGQPKTVTDELGHTSTYTLGGPLNKPTAFTDTNGNVTQYAYDAAGDVTSTTYADGSVERTIYDALGNATSLVNRRGQAIAMTYNAAGQVATESFPDGSTNTYTYDSRGRLASVNSSLQGITSFSYDDADRLTRVDYPTGRSLFYQSDAAGRRTQLADNTDYLVIYVYDSAGRLSQLLDGSNGNAVLDAYTYDAAGRLAREDKGNGTYTIYSYDAVGQVEHIVNFAPNGSVNSHFDYTYDAIGRRTSMATLDGTWTYTYDLAYQLTRAVFASTNATLPNQDLNYVYDAMGNRIRTILNGVTTEYTANRLNQYTQVGNVTYQYDADGNLIKEAGPDGTSTYTYDVKNRLVMLATPQGTWKYEYDAFGHRIATAVNDVNSDYLVDPAGTGNLIAISDGNSDAMRFTYGLGLASMSQGGTQAYYDFDVLGSVADLTSTGGTAVNTYSYLPFGRSQASMQTLANPFQFAGRSGVTTESNGLQDMRARFYNGDIGGFLSKDPLELQSGIGSFYAYVFNDPISLIDPTGLCANLGCGVPKSRGSERIPSGELGYTLGCALANSLCIETCGEKFSGLPSYCYPPPQPPPPVPPPPPPPPPKPPSNPTNNKNPKNPNSQDPNEKLAGVGFGDAGFVAADSLIPYRVNFENDQSATAPAQQVVVTDQLSTELDWSSFEFTEFGFGDTVATVPAGSQYYLASVPMTYNGHFFNVQVELSFDPTTGQVRTTFLSLDPTTNLPPDVLTGFLPPEDGSGRGMGYFSYQVRVEPALTTGAEIRNVALISFDQQTIIGTNQIDPHNAATGTDAAKEALITIDAGGPSSSVEALAAKQSSATFTVNWSGSDDTGGSGIASYEVFVSDNGGPFTPWLSDTAQTTATYTGEAGHTYSFYSLATDNVGNRELAPPSPDAETFVSLATTVALTSDHSSGTTYGDLVSFTAVVTADGGTPTGTLQFEIDGVDVGSPVVLDAGMASFSTSTLTADNHVITAFYTSGTNDYADSQGDFEQTVNPAALDRHG